MQKTPSFLSKPILVVILFTISIVNSYSEPPEGYIVPNFKLKDLNGKEHELYQYLNKGITVFVKVFGVHCGGCWEYHEQGILRNLYNEHGPNGTKTKDITVFAMQHDRDIPDLKLSNKVVPEDWRYYTKGDWVTGEPYPIFNPQGKDWDIVEKGLGCNGCMFPMFLMIKPNKEAVHILSYRDYIDYNKLYETFMPKPTNVEFSTNSNESVNVFPNPTTNLLSFKINDKSTLINKAEILDAQGKKTIQIDVINNDSSIDLSDLPNGYYTIKLYSNNGIIVKKISKTN
ncbi:MAG: T9SS C-terminal target domain-containing protein [Cytophagales bacterium]|nr:MAG: T9SS C-terminal target domain-containing protein [Cytophagales bacterium]